MKFFRTRINPNTIVLIKQIMFGLLVFSVIGLIITAVWHITRLPYFTIDNIEIIGGETISHNEIRNRVENSLDGTYVGLVPKRFSWLYPKTEILSNLEKVEKIYNISLSRKDNTSILISFSEYKPDALWCDYADRNKCLFIDKFGYAFGHAPQLTGGSFLRLLTTGEKPEVGSYIQSIDALDKIKSSIEELSNINWYVSFVEIDQANDLYFQIVGGGELKISLANDEENVVDNLQVILSTEEFSHLEPGNFQYIDLRFGNKVYINEETGVTESDVLLATTTENIIAE